MNEEIGNFNLKLINAKCAEFFLDYEKELNKNVIQRTEPVGAQVFYKPTLTKLGTTQTIYSDGNAFSLLEPDNGKLYDVPIKAEELPRILIRRIVGYRTALDIQQGKRSPKEALTVLVHEMLEALKRDLGFSHNELSWGTAYAKFSLPGKPYEFFRQGENFAGLELRLFSDVLPVIELKDEQ